MYTYIATCEDCVWSENRPDAEDAEQLAEQHAIKFNHKTGVDVMRIQ